MIVISQLGTFDVENYGDLLYPIVLRHLLQKRDASLSNSDGLLVDILGIAISWRWRGGVCGDRQRQGLVLRTGHCVEHHA